MVLANLSITSTGCRNDDPIAILILMVLLPVFPWMDFGERNNGKNSSDDDDNSACSFLTSEQSSVVVRISENTSLMTSDSYAASQPHHLDLITHHIPHVLFIIARFFDVPYVEAVDIGIRNMLPVTNRDGTT